MHEINFIDLFAGASGMSEGFIKAGFNPISHIEMNGEACLSIKTRAAFHYLVKMGREEIYKNYLLGKISRDELYKQVPNKILDRVLNIEITDSSVPEIFSKIRELLKGKSVDIIIGGPPCQAYSLLGRHQKEIDKHPRNKLYIQYGKFLKEFKPKVFVFENVPGLLSANQGNHLKDLKICFKELGYEVYCELLNSSDYGVLQDRKRLIIIGWLTENNFGFPIIEKLEKKYIVYDVLKDLEPLNAGDSLKISSYARLQSDYLHKFEMRNGDEFVTQHISRPHNKNDLKIYQYAIERWNSAKERVRYDDIPKELQTQKNTTSFLDRFKVVNGEGISHTIIAHIAKDGHYYIHPDINQCRSLSVREAARLQSFPDNFYFEGSRSAAFNQIGNAVPPLMAFAIAQKLKGFLCQMK